MRRFLEGVGRQLVEQRHVVQNPERAPLGGDYQLLFAFVERQVGDRNHRQIELKWLPIRAAVKGNEHPGFGSGYQEALAIGIFAHHAREGVVRNPAIDGRPGLAGIVGDEQVRPEIVPLIHGRGDVGGFGVVRRGFDGIDLDPFGHRFGRDIGPAEAAIARDVNQAVVRAGPDQTLLERRFGDGEDRIVVLDAAVVLGDLAARRDPAWC